MGSLERVKTPISWCFPFPLSVSFSVSLRCSSFSRKIYIYNIQMKNSVPARRNKITTMENNHNKPKTQPWKHRKETGWVSDFPCGVPLTSVTVQDHTSSFWYFFFVFFLLNSFFFLSCAHVQAGSPITHNHFPPSQLFVLRLLPSSCEYKAWQ